MKMLTIAEWAGSLRGSSIVSIMRAGQILVPWHQGFNRPVAEHEKLGFPSGSENLPAFCRIPVAGLVYYFSKSFYYGHLISFCD